MPCEQARVSEKARKVQTERVAPLEGDELLLGVGELLVLDLLHHGLVHALDKVGFEGCSKVLGLFNARGREAKVGK